MGRVRVRGRVAAHLKQVLIREAVGVKGLHGPELRLKRVEGVLDTSARLHVGALLYESTHEVAAEAGDDVLHERGA